MKDKIWRTILELGYSQLEGSIDDAISLLQSYKDKNPGKILRIENVRNRWEEGYHLELQYEDLENDEEEKKKINGEKSRIEWELKELGRLKRKYETVPDFGDVK